MPDRQPQTRRHYIKAVGTASVATLASLGGCLQSGGTQTETGDDGTIEGPIPMGSILPITGALNAYGSGMQAAVQQAVDDINEAGGVRGADLKLYTRDSETKPQQAAQKYNSLVSSQNIVGFVGAASSGVSTTIAENLASDEVMEMSNASTSPVLATLGYKTVDDEEVKLFGRTAPNDGQQGLIMGRIMNQTIEADSAAFLHVANAYGKGLADKAKAAFDGETTAVVGYDKKSQDYTSVLDTLHADDPDAIGIVGYPENGKTILQQWSAGGYNTSASDWVLSEGLNSKDFLQENSDITSDMWISAPNPEQTPGAETFQDKLGDQAGTLFAPHAYDGMFLMALAMEKSGKADAISIAKNIQSVSQPQGTKVTVGEFQEAADLLADGEIIDYQGASSPVNLNENLEPLNAFAILQVKGDGTRETIEEIPRSYFEGKL
ncbi:MAG: ABC transporter substrate-binding protein [Halobacteriales archaeon]